MSPTYPERTPFGKLKGLSVSLFLCMFTATTVFSVDERLPLTEAQVRAQSAALVGPRDWASAERVSTGVGIYDDGGSCAPALIYKNKTGQVVVSMGMEALRSVQGNPLSSFDELGKTGSLPDPPPVNFQIFCDDAGFDLIQIMGTLNLPPFESAGWLVVDHGQDTCGETSIVIYAVHGDHRVALLIPFETLVSDYICSERYQKSNRYDDDCATRTRCLRGYLATPGKRSAIESQLQAISRTLTFNWK